VLDIGHLFSGLPALRFTDLSYRSDPSDFSTAFLPAPASLWQGSLPVVSLPNQSKGLTQEFCYPASTAFTTKTQKTPAIWRGLAFGGQRFSSPQSTAVDFRKAYRD